MARATTLALDLDFDGRPNNEGGRALANMGNAYEPSELSEPLAASIRAKLEDRRVIWLLDVATCVDGSSPHARIGLRQGVAGDPVGPVAPARLPAVGKLEGGRLVAERGFGAAPITLFVDILDAAAEVGWIDADGTAFEIFEDGDELTGVIGMGLRDALSAASGTLASFFQSRIEGRDCSACESSCFSCDMDRNGDGVIDRDEVEKNSLIQALFAPDVDLFLRLADGREVYRPGEDGERDRLSLGIGFRAVPLQ